MEMLVDICSSSQERSRYIEKMLRAYMEAGEFPVSYQCFYEMDTLKNDLMVQLPHILILAMEDIDNQEIGVWLRGFSKKPRIIWIGEDKRFGLASYRISATYFILYPPRQEEFFDSLKRCLHQLSGKEPVYSGEI